MKKLAHIIAGIAVASTSFSLASIIIRMALYSGAEPIQLAGWRLITASILTFTILKIKSSNLHLPLSTSQVMMTLGGGLLLGLHMSLWNVSLSLASIALAATIVNMYPVILLFSDLFLFKTRVKAIQIIGVILSLVAVASLTMTAGNEKGELVGSMLAFMAMLCVAGYLVIGKMLRETLNVLEYTFYAYLVGGVTALLFSAIIGSSITLSLEILPYVLLLALLPTLLGHTIVNALARVTSLTVASIPPLLEPVGASILAWILFGESLLPYRWIAVIVAVAGAFLVVSGESR